MKEERPKRAYRELGLPVSLHRSEVLRCPNCGWSDDTVSDLAGLRDAVVCAVVTKRERLTPVEIRFLRKHLGWSGVELSDYMGSTPETVSRWENGRTAMGTTADRLLRLFVALSGDHGRFSFNTFRMAARRPARATQIDIEFRAGRWQRLAQ